MRHTWTLTKIRIKLAFRSRVFAFFSVLMPLAIFFLYSLIWARVSAEAPGYTLSMSLALTVMGSFWGMSMQLVSFRETGILRRFRLAPIRPTALLASGMISNFVLVIPTIVIQFLCARWIFHMKADIAVIPAILLAIGGILTFSALGLIVASVTNTMQETQVVNNLLWMMFLFLSGATIPLPIYPDFMQKFALFLPSTYLVTELQGALRQGYVGGRSLLEALVSLGASFLLAFLISSRLFRWEPDQKHPPRAKLWVAIGFIPFLIVGSYEVANGHRLREAREAFRAITERAASQQNMNQK